jgi:hypothetical protein
MRWAGNAAPMGDKINECRALVGKPEESTRKTRYRWEDNIKTDLREIGYGLD